MVKECHKVVVLVLYFMSYTFISCFNRIIQFDDNKARITCSCNNLYRANFQQCNVVKGKTVFINYLCRNNWTDFGALWTQNLFEIN